MSWTLAAYTEEPSGTAAAPAHARAWRGNPPPGGGFAAPVYDLNTVPVAPAQPSRHDDSGPPPAPSDPPEQRLLEKLRGFAAGAGPSPLDLHKAPARPSVLDPHGLGPRQRFFVHRWAGSLSLESASSGGGQGGEADSTGDSGPPATAAATGGGTTLRPEASTAATFRRKRNREEAVAAELRRLPLSVLEQRAREAGWGGGGDAVGFLIVDDAAGGVYTCGAGDTKGNRVGRHGGGCRCRG
eukprot:gene33103-35019_t